MSGVHNAISTGRLAFGSRGGRRSDEEERGKPAVPKHEPDEPACERGDEAPGSDEGDGERVHRPLEYQA